METPFSGWVTLEEKIKLKKWKLDRLTSHLNKKMNALLRALEMEPEMLSVQSRVLPPRCYMAKRIHCKNKD